ncbi:MULTISPECIES: hypothetical protein [Streptomyces]|uniref:Membrane protein n=1 Tax=Streptomyces viridochromogenes TaxID=1938 RepID=A0A0L8J7Y4_STRVR|nr:MULTISPECIES: hypothetical protein [Streptomyces]KOG09735.1 membrane protein [Streptomyces viridochromogenes]
MSNDHYYGGQQYDPYANGRQDGQQPPADVTQTWEGQTWDTTYQPAVSHDQIQAARAAAPYGTPETAYQQQPYGQPYPQPAEQPYQQPYGQHPVYADQAVDQAGHLAGHQAGHRAGDHVGHHAAQQQAAAAAPAPAPVPVSVPAPVAQAAEAAGPAYSSPTTSGNTRITDAQRARAEGRSPIIDPGMQPAALTAVLGLLLAGGAALGSYGLLVPLVLLQALTAAGWFRLNGMWPARQGIALAFAGGLVADAALLATGREHAAPAILGTLGVWVLLCLVLQLRSHADPDERMYGLMATIASAALTVVATGHLGAEPDAVVVGGAAVAAAVLARALPLPGPVSPIAALLAAAGAGVAAGGLTDLGTSGALLGLGAGVCALIGLRVASYDYPSRFVHMTAGVALPLTAAAPAVYLLGRALA